MTCRAWTRHRTVTYAATASPSVTTRRRRRSPDRGCSGLRGTALTAGIGRGTVPLLPGAFQGAFGFAWRCEIAVYVYRCPEHGPTETTCAMGAATAVVVCPVCGAVAGRVFTAPRLALGSAARWALIERTERSSEQPDVVAAPPSGPHGARRADVGRNPALSRLPRP